MPRTQPKRKTDLNHLLVRRRGGQRLVRKQLPKPVQHSCTTSVMSRAVMPTIFDLLSMLVTGATAAFTWQSARNGGQLIIDTVNNPAEVNRSNTRVMGAGDSLGATLSLANIWDVEKLMHCYAKESNIKSPNKELVATAGIVFVSLFSRYIGECAYRSKECDICDIPVENVRPLMDRAAKEAWQTARELWTYSAKPGVALTETTGIRVAIWELEQG